MVHFIALTKHHIVFSAFCLFSLFSSPNVWAQLSPEPAATGDVAYVYVSTATGGSTQTIEGFAANAAGVLTPLASTQEDFWGGMASNGQFLFGSNGINITSFAIEPGGALRKLATLSARRYNGAACGGPSQLFLDRTGTTLYDLDNYGSQCANNTYQAFTIESTGTLKYAGGTLAASPVFATQLSFLSSNLTGYGSTCYHYSASIYGFNRASSGSLRLSTTRAPLPAPQAGNFYCPFLAATDGNNNVTVSVQQLNAVTWLPVGSPQIATYAATASGSLSTKSTYTNMPKTSVNTVYDLKASPSGKLLAVAGSAGIQIFHFNGSAPATRYTGLLTNDEIDQMAWDASNHLYAISRVTNKLYVFTATPTSASEAVGSPYSVPNAVGIIVVPTI